MWASLRDYWQDFKAGRESARYFAFYCLFLSWMIYMAFSH